MAKKKTRVIKKRKIHPLLATLMGFFAVMLVAVAFTAHIYKDVSPLQQVAGVEDTVISGTPTGSPTPHPSISPRPSSAPQSCMVVLAVRGLQPCGKDSYKSMAAICGDSSQAKITSDGQCRSLVSWFTKLAQACTKHSSCKSPTPTPKLTGTLTPGANKPNGHNAGRPSVSPVPTHQ